MILFISVPLGVPSKVRSIHHEQPWASQQHAPTATLPWKHKAASTLVANRQELYIKDEVGVRGYDAGCAAGPITQAARALEGCPLAQRQLLEHDDLPSLDHLALPDREAERPSLVPARIELLPVHSVPT